MRKGVGSDGVVEQLKAVDSFIQHLDLPARKNRIHSAFHSLNRIFAKVL